MSDDRLIVALDVPNALAGLALAEKLGDAVSFYKIGLGMLTGGGLGLANELKQEHGKRIFLDMKLFDIGATVENAVRGLAQFDLDFLTVHGDPNVVRAAKEGASGKDLKILAVTILTSLDRNDLDANLIKPGEMQDLVRARGSGLGRRSRRSYCIATRGGAHSRAARGKGSPDRHPRRAPHRQRCWRPKAHCNPCQSHHRRRRSYRDRAPDLASRRSPADHTRHLGQPALIPPSDRGAILCNCATGALA